MNSAFVRSFRSSTLFLSILIFSVAFVGCGSPGPGSCGEEQDPFDLFKDSVDPLVDQIFQPHIDETTEIIKEEFYDFYGEHPVVTVAVGTASCLVTYWAWENDYIYDPVKGWIASCVRVKKSTTVTKGGITYISEFQYSPLESNGTFEFNCTLIR